MDRIVVAAKPGTEHPWIADATAQLAKQTGAAVDVVSVDGVELEALSLMPRSEFAVMARQAVDRMVARLQQDGVRATGEVRPGQVVRGILLFAEEQDADMIVCGASSRGPIASRVLGNVPLELIQRARRPIMVITAPPK
jgi:nucleotide-binding universal stress UspA family protein